MLDITPKNIRVWSRLGSRGTLGLALLDLASSKKNLIVMSADLGQTSGLGRFISTYPTLFYNLGIAESNMVGVAAGMAKEGSCVFATTFSNFLSMRAYEQIRLNLGYMQLPVHLVGVASGFEMGMFGNTHYGIEDMALMRMVPNLTVLSPADGMEIIKIVNAVAESSIPTYIRLTGSQSLPIIYHEDYDLVIGNAITLCDGDDITIISTGSMVYTSLQVAHSLVERGFSCKVVNMHTIKPLDTNVIKNSCGAQLIVTVEEHSLLGGLGGAVAEVLSEIPGHPPLLRIGIPDSFPHAGTYEYLIDICGLTREKITEKIISTFNLVNSTTSI